MNMYSKYCALLCGLFCLSSQAEELIAPQVFEGSNTQIMQALVAAIPELEELKKPNATSAEAGPGTDIEFKRTIGAIKCLYWLLTGDYESFSRNQPPAVKIQQSSFEWLADLTRKTHATQDRIDAQYYSLAINDLGKVFEIQNKVNEFNNSSIHEHDAILAALFKLDEASRDTILPTFKRLSPQSQRYVEMLLTAPINLAQFAQLESVPAEANALRSMTPEQKNFLFVHIMCDVMGALGHVDLDSSRTFVEPAAKTYKNMYQALFDPKGDYYSAFMKLQALRFNMIKKINDRLTGGQEIIVRLATMLRSDTPAQAQMVKDAFDALDSSSGKVLRSFLAPSGTRSHGEQIKIEYAPALLLAAKAKNKLVEGLAILSMVFSKVKLNRHQARVVIVDARNLVELLKDDIDRSVLERVKLVKVNDSEYRFDKLD